MPKITVTALVAKEVRKYALAGIWELCLCDTIDCRDKNRYVKILLDRISGKYTRYEKRHSVKVLSRFHVIASERIHAANFPLLLFVF
jgi:hypothetical protein